MLKWLIRRQLAAFERTYDYDIGYLREILEADVGAALKLRGIQALGRYRRGVPLAPWFTAKLIGSMREDCGPCTQLVVRMAERAGVAPTVLRAVVARDLAALPPDVALAYRFGEAAIAHEAAADGLREQVLARWGAQGLVSLSYALTTGRLYPTLKYALGHGQACTRVNVAGSLVPVLRPAT